MAGDPLKKPWWVLTMSRRGSWLFAVLYTVLAGLEPLIAFSSGFWWWWLIGAFFALAAVVAWLSLISVLRHPPASSNRTSPRRVEDGDDAGP